MTVLFTHPLTTWAGHRQPQKAEVGNLTVYTVMGGQRWSWERAEPSGLGLQPSFGQWEKGPGRIQGGRS